MVFEKPIVVDCRGHLLGRLASLVAKELLQGQHVVAVRCEQLEISGSRTRDKPLHGYLIHHPGHGHLPIHVAVVEQLVSCERHEVERRNECSCSRRWNLPLLMYRLDELLCP
ncbi:hypothetical protein PsorP6_013986 [Peronosclerospora sorghi]|uniref:Uncharacterized protein n=1 Tax=Peronosclerospora sorghi TaxID=230839 RepID=A0ACC0VIR2_9STRA|nr:hypothetical protein PsorP6_013986 [Peronosclerospora sorghi]